MARTKHQSLSTLGFRSYRQKLCGMEEFISKLPGATYRMTLMINTRRSTDPKGMTFTLSSQEQLPEKLRSSTLKTNSAFGHLLLPFGVIRNRHYRDLSSTRW